MDVKKAAAETKDYIVSIRREFHRHPELSLQEFRTAQRIEEELDKFGIPHTDRKSTRLNSSHQPQSRMPSSA